MSTVAIQTPNILLNDSPSQARSPERTASENPFDRMLSKEVAERKAASEDKQAHSVNNHGKDSKDAVASTAKKTSDETADDPIVDEATNAEQLLVLVGQLDTTDTASSHASYAVAGNVKYLKQTMEAGIDKGKVIPDEFTEMMEPVIEEEAAIKKNAEGEDIEGLLAGNAILKGEAEKKALSGSSRLISGISMPENAAVTNPLQNALIHNPHTAQALASQATGQLAPTVATSDWNQALGQQVVWMANDDIQSASLNLNPPELGPLRIILKISNNQVNASFVAAQPEVRQALEDAMPRLREMLGDAGIQLGQANVSAETSQNQNSGNELMKERNWGAQANDSTDVSVNIEGAPIIRRGLVDTFV